MTIYHALFLFQNGIKIMKEKAVIYAEWHEEQTEETTRAEEEQENRRDIEPLEGKIKWEELKKCLFEYLYTQE